MAKRGSGGWVKRTKSGNSTKTYNSRKGTTYSYSQGSKGNRTTYTSAPGGKTKITRTTTSGGYTKRESRTISNVFKAFKSPEPHKSPRVKFSKGIFKRSPRYRGKTATLPWWMYIIIFIIILIIFS